MNAGKTIVQRIGEKDYGFAIIDAHTKEYNVIEKVKSMFQFANGNWKVKITTMNTDGKVMSAVTAVMKEEELNDIVDLF